ncbi:M1 family aminopeptidase [Chitinophaga solisilvae]|uniref:M1 family aminopeptidase n=1 Tax=Chitinophaga solisilvae TaxID=1233460 RepID=UPI00136FB604|nr:M1 family aminopeptidase [Chitinophaga solisilvae]
MHRLVALLCLLLPLSLVAQHKLDYQLQVRADLSQKSFNVQGHLTFLTDAACADSVDIVISRGVGAATLRLEGAQAKMDTSVNHAGDIVYRWHFVKTLPAATPLRFTYAYERGSAPTFQFYLDTAYCMAGGYGSAWYPQVIAQAPDGTGDYLRGTGVITVTTPLNIMPVMAACTVVTTTATRNHTYEFRYAQPDIFSLYIGNYSRQEYKGNRAFNTYSLSKAVDGNDISRKAAAVLDYLATQFGPLTIPNFSIIEYPEYVAEQTGIGGASILGGVAMPSGALRQFNYALFGHEIGHQWWGNKVMVKGSKGKSMVSECMAQYGSLQVVSHFDGAHAMEYRKTGYPGYIKDQCGLGYLKNAAAGNDEPMATLSDKNGHILGDSKGFMTLELLSNTIGKPAFNKALQTIGEKYSKDGVTWENFLDEMEKAHGGSLQVFYQQWFNRTGAPSWESSWTQQQRKLQLKVTQKDSLYQLPLEVLITYTNGTTSLQKIAVKDRSQQIQLPVTGTVKTVQLDPYFKVLHWDEELTPLAYSQAKVVKVLNLRMQRKNDEAVKLAESYIREGLPEDNSGVEFSLLYQLGRIAAVQQRPEAAIAYYQRSLQCVSRPADLLAMTYYRIAQLAAGRHDVALVEWACANALKADAANNNSDGIEAKVAPLLETLGKRTSS